MKVKKWKIALYAIHMIAILTGCVLTVQGTLNHAQCANLFLIMHFFVALFWWL